MEDATKPNLQTKLRNSIHIALSGWLHRGPEPQLQTDRLYLYLDTLYQTREIPGAVVEVGCFQGGTAVFASRFLRRINCERRYVCIDTFGGFPKSQFAKDVELGTGQHLANGFSANSEPLVQKLLNQWGCQEIELIKADIAALNESRLPEEIAVALIDVDIAEPTDAALRKIMPRMSTGGVVLVDDCDQVPFKGARIAVEKICQSVEYRFGMGIINSQHRQTR
jgi:O-methyltransferase